MILSYPTALDYWLNADGFPSDFVDFENVSFAETQHIPTFFPPCINRSQKLHAIVKRAGQRRVRDNVCFHVLPQGIPSNRLVRISKNLYVIRPELCFLFATRELSVPALILLANNLCSIYRPDVSSEFGQTRRNPVTSTAKIIDYLSHINSTRGLNKALRAVRYASDRSNSPIESILATLARLPISLGGFALPELSLNCNIILSKAAAEFAGKEYYCCDLVWVRQKLIVEYDSSLDHLTRSQHNKDKKRATALIMSGYSVFNLTWGHLENPKKVELLFYSLRNKIGLRNYKERFQKTKKVREQTIKQLLYNSGIGC